MSGKPWVVWYEHEYLGPHGAFHSETGYPCRTSFGAWWLRTFRRRRLGNRITGRLRYVRTERSNG